VGTAVGLGVGTAVGLGVGRGVGSGGGGVGGAVTATVGGLTDVSAVVFCAPGSPLFAANEYAWVPTGSCIVLVKVTPVS
jgi:hypothetical protein